MIACVGRGGTDSGSPTFGRIGYRMIDYDFPFPANSTAGCTVHTRDFVFFGGSQHAGGGDADEFQTDAPRVVAAKALLDPLALLGHAAGGWTYLRGVETDPTTKASIASEFGPEVGMMVYLHQQGKLAGARVLGRYQLGTPTPDWVATHFATLVTNVTAAGLNPSVVFYIVGGQDSTNLAAIANLQSDLQKLAWLVEAAWPGALFVVRGVVAEDAVTFTQLTRARVEGSRIIREPLRGKRLWVPHDASGPVELQPTDNTHPTDAGTYDMGFDDYGPIAAAQAA
jgi:hypothetical protein